MPYETTGRYELTLSPPKSSLKGGGFSRRPRRVSVGCEEELMDFRILGPLEVRDDDGPLELGGRKQRSLLAVLLLHGNQVLSTDSLISALWDDSLPETAATALQGYVSQLRKA